MPLFSKNASKNILKDSTNNIEHQITQAKKRLFSPNSLVNHSKATFDVLYDNGFCKLRHYPPLPKQKTLFKTPILLITPLAVTPNIYDLLKSRSLVRFLLQQGFSVYMIDWGKPTRKQSLYGFNYYVTEAIPAMIKAVRDYSGSQEISLHGWSMGGLFSMLYAAYTEDKHIKNMVLVGAPVDGYASGYIGKLVKTASMAVNLSQQATGFHPKKIPSQLMHTHGWMNALAFKVIDPIGTIKSYWHLLKKLNDAEALSENAAKSMVLNHMLDYPGEIIKDVAIRFWLENSLIKGTFKLKNKTIDLSAITANLLVISGKTDMIVTSDAANAIFDYASSKDTHFIEAIGGHVGILSSKKTSEMVWPQLSAWLSERSTKVNTHKL